MRKYLPKGRFARNITHLASGTIVAQLIAFLAIPVLTRLYDPSDFGVLAAYASLLGIISVIANMRYQLAIPLPSSNKEASAILVLCFIITIIVSMVTLVLVLLWRDRFGQWLDNDKISQYLWLLPVGVFFIGIYQALNYWAIREKDLKVVAQTKVWQSITMIGIQLALFKFNSLALILGHALGQSAGVTRLAKSIICSKALSLKNVTASDIVFIARRYKKFPLISSWAGLFNSIGNLAPNLLIAALYSPTAAGLFFLANRIIMTPLSIIGGAIGQSFYAEAAEAHQNKTLSALTIKVAKRLLLVIIPPMLVIFLWGEVMVTFSLGEEWKESGNMIEWLSFMMVAQFITSPLSSIFSITEQQTKGMMLQLLLMAIRIASIFYAHLQNESVVTTVIYYSISSFMGYFIYFIYLVKPVGKHDKKIHI